MPRTQRSPPTYTPRVVPTKPDSEHISESSDDNVNSATRSNKRRACFSPSQDFKNEIQQMLRSWKEEQQTNLTKFCDSQTSCLNKLVSEVAEIKSQNLEIQKYNIEFEKSLNFICQQYEDMKKQIETLQKEKQTYRETVQTLESKILDLQRLSRPSTIEIRNVPAKENEAASDLHTIITKVGSAVDVTLNNTHLRDIYRLPGKSDTVRPIVAEFSSVTIKNEVLAAARNYNRNHSSDGRLSTQSIGLTGDRRPIYISEHLPASSKRLFFATKEFAKSRGYAFCWTTNGNIFLRKIAGAKQILIKSEQALLELQEKEAQ